MPGEEEKPKKKRYFSIFRISALVLWALALYFLPHLLSAYGFVPQGAEFVPMLLIFVSLFIILVKKVSFKVGVALVIFCAYFCLYQPVFLREVIDGLNNRMSDSFYVIRGPKKPTNQVVIVDIDQKSLETVGQWPWPRSQSARTIRNMMEDGAQVIGYDIVFAEPGRLSLADWVERLDDMGIEVKLPGKTVEESREMIEEGEWDIDVPGSTVKEAVLEYWQEIFEENDPDFYIDTEDPQEREAMIVEKFLSLEEAQWNKDQDSKKIRLENAGQEYTAKPYILPEDVLLQMVSVSGELFYLDSNWGERHPIHDSVTAVMDNDYEFGEAIGEAPVVAGGLFIMGGRSGATELKKGEVHSEGMVLTAPIWNAEELLPGIREAEYQVLNVPEIQENANFQGMFNIVPDKSGAARFYTMMLKAPTFEEAFVAKEGVDLSGAAALDPDNYEMQLVQEMNIYPAISLQMLRVANGYNHAEVVVRDGQRGLLLKRDHDVTFGTDAVLEDMGIEREEAFAGLLPPEHFIPLDFKGDIRINFLGYGGRWGPGASASAEYFMPYISMSDVLFKRYEPGFFKDKYVIIGSTDPTLSDLVGSPFRPAFPGLEVHATMLENLITSDFLVDLGERGTLYQFIGVLVGGTILSALIAFTGPWIAGLFMGSMLAFLPTMSYWGQAHHGMVIEFVYPWLCTLFIGVVVILVNFFVEGREKRFLNATFKNYLSPELIDQMIESGATPKLGGSEDILTAYFTDIQSFSTFSEKLGSPTKLVELLNEYLTAMTDILLENQGTLDKYEGDAIIAFFGAPMPLKNHAEASCQSALHMQEKLIELRAKWRSEGDKWPQIVHDMRMRIGINTGPIVTGNMGSTVRMNYTMMGDTVNLAARLESGAKQYGVFSMCSEDTILATDGKFLAREIDKIRVVGKNLPVVVYELLYENPDEAPEDLVKLVKLFEEGKKLYAEMKWDEAIAKFEECMPLEIHHPDREPGCKTTPSHVFIARCNEYKENPPVAEGEEWDGVYTATSK